MIHLPRLKQEPTSTFMSHLHLAKFYRSPNTRGRLTVQRDNVVIVGPGLALVIDSIVNFATNHNARDRVRIGD
jgi:hypothetical protein